jgi:hypothetical protein
VRPLPAAALVLLALPFAAARGGEPERDPFVAALRGLAGREAVAEPGFDAAGEASAWTLRPRREIVDGLALRILRGEAVAIDAREAGPGELVEPADAPAPAAAPLADPLAPWLPADAAAALFPSLDGARAAVDGLLHHLPRLLPRVAADPPWRRRDAFARASGSLLLPTLWGSNPYARTGLREVAVVAADPDLRGAPDVALVGIVEDASLVRAQRLATFSWEERGRRPLRVEGLDATAGDGSVRSFFALEGGVAIWATTRALRKRILDAGAGRAPSLATAPAADLRRARAAFPAAAGGALLVLPDAFVARIGRPEVRRARFDALLCEAERLLVDAGRPEGRACPSGGALRPAPGRGGASCGIHGTAAFPAPLADLAGAAVAAAAPGLPADRGPFPPAAHWEGATLSVLLPAGPAGDRCFAALGSPDRVESRRFVKDLLRENPPSPWGAQEALRPAVTGLATTTERGPVPRTGPPPPRTSDVLRVRLELPGDVAVGDAGLPVLRWR